ncbi:hypothetical protein P7K49_001547 [Saguinus oedipus]|uniref:Uncharacterized protein n=1 Tax=Saguinus oedipus TaxID=9490 RepID=A0ABQ9WEX2_SAGOE|nr:hypothetical protein P7K49_001547 [Saguinus oedipus]
MGARNPSQETMSHVELESQELDASETGSASWPIKKSHGHQKETSERNENASLQELKMPAITNPTEDKRRDQGTGNQSNPLPKKPMFQPKLASE